MEKKATKNNKKTAKLQKKLQKLNENGIKNNNPNY